MSRYPLPKPTLNEEIEAEIWNLLQKGFEANRWRPDFEEWTQKRLWAERHQDRVMDTLERGVLEGRSVKGLRVLDLGSGRGGLSVMLAIRGAKVTALDLRKRNCRILRLRASRYGLKVKAVRAVGEALPFASGVFDLVICKDVTEHCRNPDRLLEEIARVLTGGGRAYVTFINRFAWIDPHYKLPGINLLPRSLAEAAIRLAGRAKPNIRDLQRLSDMHYYTLGGAERAARRRGLELRNLSLWHLRNAGISRLRRLLQNRLFLGPDTFETVLTRRIP